MTVLGRIGQPADIAELVVLLAHSDHRWITAGSPLDHRPEHPRRRRPHLTQIRIVLRGVDAQQ